MENPNNLSVDEAETCNGHRPEDIDSLVNSLSQDYASFLEVDESREAKLLEEALESNMALLESFCLELEAIRANGTLCLETLYPQLQLKAQEMKKLYDRIDFLETVVNRVKKTVNLMEVEVVRAEKSLDSSPSVKKLLSSIFKSSQVTSHQKIEAFNPPDVFRTEDLFHEEHDDAHEVQESSRFH